MVGAAACGGSKPAQEVTQAQTAQQAQTAPQAQKDAAPGVTEMAKGFEAMAKGAKEMEALSNLPPVDPVSFRVFEPLFPELSGWEKGTPEGEKMTAPIAISQSQLDYRKGDARINAKIVDSGQQQDVHGAVHDVPGRRYERETSHGYEKSIKFGDYPAWEQWDSQGKSGELNILVNKRFLVTLDGNDIENTKVLHELAGKIDLREACAAEVADLPADRSELSVVCRGVARPPAHRRAAPSRFRPPRGASISAHPCNSRPPGASRLVRRTT